MSNLIVPIILAGGAGQRLWPLSSEKKPKQFLNLLGKNSLFQDTLLRIKDIPNIADPIFVGNISHLNLAKQQLDAININGYKNSHFIAEPFGRNTAPAITIAVQYAQTLYSDPILLVLPSDHAVTNREAFKNAIISAVLCAKYNYLVTFAVKPSRPDTEYGYIKFMEQLPNVDAYRLAQFIEKPDAAKAAEYIESGCYCWNSGMFMFKAGVYLREAAVHAPDILIDCEETLAQSRIDHKILFLAEQQFKKCRKISIDFAIMEKTKKSGVVMLDAGWSDVGSWRALWELSNKDKCGNVAVGKVFLENVYNCYIYSDNAQLALANISDQIIIAAEKYIFIGDKNSANFLRTCAEKFTVD